MTLDLVNYEKGTQQAIAAFWKSRELAIGAQKGRGVVDAGTRGAVTSGKNMNGFLPLIEDILRANGLSDAVIDQNRAIRTLPGYFRPTKNWDYIVTHHDRLVAILEMKSQVGSFGNNFNNRCEEALGNATDLWTAFREGAFGDSPRPFLGYLMLVEDSPKSRAIVRAESKIFRIFPEFEKTSYIDRYRILCRKLVSENLYTVAAVITSPTGSVNGTYSECCEATGMKRFVTTFAASIAATAAEKRP